MSSYVAGHGFGTSLKERVLCSPPPGFQYTLFPQEVVGGWGSASDAHMSLWYQELHFQGANGLGEKETEKGSRAQEMGGRGQPWVVPTLQSWTGGWEGPGHSEEVAEPECQAGSRCRRLHSLFCTIPAARIPVGRSLVRLERVVTDYRSQREREKEPQP